ASCRASATTSRPSWARPSAPIARTRSAPRATAGRPAPRWRAVPTTRPAPPTTTSRLAELDRLQAAGEADQERSRQGVLDLAAPVLRVLDDLARLVALLGREFANVFSSLQLLDQRVLLALLGIAGALGGGGRDLALGLDVAVLLGARRALAVARSRA